MALSCTACITLLTAGLLVSLSRPTVVELRLSVAAVGFEVLPILEAFEEGGPSVVRQASLFDPAFVIRALEARDAVCLETTLEDEGRLWLSPGHDGRVLLQSAEPFTPELLIQEPTQMRIEAMQAGKLRLSLWLNGDSGTQEISCQAKSLAANQGWRGHIPTSTAFSARLQGARAWKVPGGAGAGLAATGNYTVPSDAPKMVLRGGAGVSRLNLALPRDLGPTTRLRLLDLDSGEIVENRDLPELLTEARTATWGNRLVLLDPQPVEIRRRRLLRPDVRVRSLELARRVKLETQSFLLGGTLRFPAGEKGAIELESGFYAEVSLKDGDSLNLRSIELVGDHMELVLWGEPSSIKIGPTPDLLSECLPSYIEWLYTHKLATLLYGAVAWLAGTTFTALKLLGVVRPKGGD